MSSSQSRHWHGAFAWLWVFAVLGLVLILSQRALVPPPPLGRDAPAEQFSEARARNIVRVLSEDIGRRVNGTEPYDRAVAYLSSELRKIPGVEVATQEDAGVYFHPFGPSSPIVYRVTNVLGRLPGRSSEAILLDAHFDTLADSVGAADDAAGVACIVEALRALAHKAPLDRTIVVSLNGGEERGQLGAVSVLKHPWVKDAHAYIYLEALPGGRSVLIGSGPGNPWLARTFAREVRLPLGNVLAQELAQSGLLPFAGDFTPFHNAGLAGLDLAMTGDAWALHTELDRLDRLDPGGMQHMGEATLSAARALSSEATRLAFDAKPAVYYDLLGSVMVTHAVSTGRWLGLGAIALFVFVLGWMRARGVVSLPSVLAAFGWSFLGLLAAVFAALLPTLVLRALHRSAGWYSSPALVLACFVLPAMAAMLAMQAWWRKRAMRRMGDDVERVSWTLWLGGLLFWTFWLLLATLAGVGVGYVPLHWVGWGALAVLVAAAFPKARMVAAVAGLVPGAIVTVGIVTMLVANLVPMAGIVPSVAPIDCVLAVLVALGTGLVGTVAFVVPCRTGGAGRIALVSAILGLAGIALVAAHWPYTAARPKRLLAVHAANDQTSALLLAGEGVEGTRPLLGVLSAATVAPPSWPPPYGLMEPPTLMLPAGEPAMPPPKVEVSANEVDPASGVRRVSLHLHGTSPELQLTIPARSLLGWSASAKLPPLPPNERNYQVMFEGVRGDGVDFQLMLQGSQPVDIVLRGIDGKRPSGPEMQALGARLPDWVTLRAFSYRMTYIQI